MDITMIGVAGYMGSGKSTFSRILSEMGEFKIIDADQEAKKMMLQHISIQERLIAAFGDHIIQNGTLSFNRLGMIVFSSLEKLQQLNTIVHPLLLHRLRELIFNGCDNRVIVDAALLPLWNVDKWFTTCIWVDAAPNIRFDRILKKTFSFDTEVIRQRMRLQEDLFPIPSEATWNYIKNEGDIADLRRLAEIYCYT